MRFVTYSVGEGLCNRLRIHLIAHAYALHAKAILVLDWPTVQAFGARYQELFSLTDVMVSGSSAYGQVVLRLFKPRKIRFNGRQGPDFTNVADLPVPRYGLVDFGEVFMPFANENGGRVLGIYKERVLAALQPLPTIVDNVNLLKQRLRGPTVGVHIRRGDFHISFPDKLLPIEFYQHALREITKWEPAVGFYLSSDDHAFVAPLIEEFAAVVNPKAPRQSPRDSWSVFGYDNRCNRDTVQGAREAVTDLFMLKETDAILGAPGSSFSEMAAFIGGSALVLPEDGTQVAARRCAHDILAALGCEAAPDQDGLGNEAKHAR
jgi:hypothetical protein